MQRSSSASWPWRRIAFWSASGSLKNIETSDGVLMMHAIADGV
jgi:hypothetical protein